MVLTRRQSGKLPPPPPKNPDGKVETVSDSEIYTHKSPKRQKTSVVAKKSRTTSRSSVKVIKPMNTSNSKAETLSILHTMPLDILFEIFSLLHPLDLLRLTHTNKSLRRVLRSRSSNTVWKASRNLQGVRFPPCPPDLSELAWASLVCGAPRCCKCATSRTTKITWVFRIRICALCLWGNSVDIDSFPTAFPSHDPSILTLIPYQRNNYKPFYWEDMIYDMGMELGAFQKAVFMRQPGAKLALNKFIARKTSESEEVMTHANLCARWESEEAKRQLADQAKIRKERLRELNNHLLSIGWDSRDIELRVWMPVTIPLLNSKKSLTERALAKLQEDLEPRWRQKRDRRLAAERNTLIERRKGKLKVKIIKWKKTLAPADWAYLPPFRDICNMDDFASVLNSDITVGIQGPQFDGGISKLPELVSMWYESKKQQMEALLPSGTRVDLALFRCCEKFFYFPAVVHHEHDQVDATMSHVERASDAMTRLLLALELDEPTTTIANLESLDPRLLCQVCIRKYNANSARGRAVYTWRAAIEHFCESNSAHHSTAEWQVLQSDQATDIKRRECDDARSDRSWICNHCSEHASQPENWDLVEQHVKQTHDIAIPVEGVDLFHDQTLGRRARSTAALLKAPGDYLCSNCTGEKGERRFFEQGVRMHNRDVHGVQTAVEGTDFSKLPSGPESGENAAASTSALPVPTSTS